MSVLKTAICRIVVFDQRGPPAYIWRSQNSIPVKQLW
jgi:hypothetical protein